MPATVRAAIQTGAAGAPTIASAETEIKWNREDTPAGTTPVPIPAAAGTEDSFAKWLFLDVTGTSTTSLSNRKLQLAAALAAGLTQAFQATNTYAQETAPVAAAAGANDAIVAGFTQINTTGVVYDAAAVGTGTAGRNGQFARVYLGVSALFTGGAGNATVMPDLRLVYDEA